ncbi:PREDICTED: uncharacterized protein LOC105570341 [Vollenhovia emeryi]|uniref:uncharacterized protein LOC105570341 n=1 Tax=Vollenhovia emeryi TaxID=411798 RepID=UPI0005F45221|nr:PREDICTED: uncharacterized protein LOC105570341 [Vollenhovia emeryi]
MRTPDAPMTVRWRHGPRAPSPSRLLPPFRHPHLAPLFIPRSIARVSDTVSLIVSFRCRSTTSTASFARLRRPKNEENEWETGRSGDGLRYSFAMKMTVGSVDRLRCRIFRSRLRSARAEHIIPGNAAKIRSSWVAVLSSVGISELAF